MSQILSNQSHKCPSAAVIMIQLKLWKFITLEWFGRFCSNFQFVFLIFLQSLKERGSSGGFPFNFQFCFNFVCYRIVIGNEETGTFLAIQGEGHYTAYGDWLNFAEEVNTDDDLNNYISVSWLPQHGLWKSIFTHSHRLERNIWKKCRGDRRPCHPVPWPLHFVSKLAMREVYVYSLFYF